jgi:hypothetical protein
MGCWSYWSDDALPVQRQLIGNIQQPTLNIEHPIWRIIVVKNLGIFASSLFNPVSRLNLPATLRHQQTIEPLRVRPDGIGGGHDGVGRGDGVPQITPVALSQIRAGLQLIDRTDHCAPGERHRAAAGRNDQTRPRSGITIAVGLDVVGDNAQSPGLGRSDRGNVEDRAEGDAAQNKMDCDCFYWTASGWLPVICMVPPARPKSRKYHPPL